MHDKPTDLETRKGSFLVDASDKFQCFFEDQTEEFNVNMIRQSRVAARPPNYDEGWNSNLAVNSDDKKKQLQQSKFLSVLTIACIIPSMLFIHGFSAMGYGRENMVLSREFDNYSVYIMAGMAIFSGTMCLLDVFYWDSLVGKAFRDTSIAIMFICTVVIVFLKQDSSPTGPLCAFVVGIPLWLLGIKYFFCDTVHISYYTGWLSSPLRLTSIAIMGTWFYWVFWNNANEWDNEKKLEYSVALGCKPNFSTLSECMNKTLYNSTGEMDTCFQVNSESTDEIYFDEGCEEYCLMVYNKCVHAFLLWANPILAGIALFMLSFICEFLHRKTGLSDWRIILSVKVYVLLLFAMWCAASLAGAGEGLSRAFFSFALASFTAVGIFTFPMTTAFQLRDDQARMKETFLEAYSSYLDIFRSLLVITCAPIALLYLFWSALNQCVRQMSFPCSKKITRPSPPRNKNWKSWLTDETLQLIDEFDTWDHCKIYRYAIYWGLMYMSMEIFVQKFTVFFLSWLINTSANMSLPYVTAIIFVAGMFLFLFPPVPGGPIYIASGIILVSSGRKTIGIFTSIIYACCLSLVLKLTACALQQKLIGENLSKSIKVRQLVKINSRVVQAVKLILARKGLSIPKIAVLVGGPDWPTSVLCGILHVDLIPCLVGTTPMIFIIIPMVLTGSFTYMASLPPINGVAEYPWAGTVCAAVAVITSGLQFGSMALAAHYIEITMTHRQVEIDQMPIDLQVLEADKQAESIEIAYNKVQKWDALPSAMQWSLRLSLIAMIISCYVVSLFNSWCFAEFNLLESSDDDNGYVLGFIKPMGIAVISLFLLSCLVLTHYIVWANRKANEIVSITEANFKLDETGSEISKVYLTNENSSLQAESPNRFSSPGYGSIA